MAPVKQIDGHELVRLKIYQRHLTPQQYKTLRGQILAGDADGARKGLRKIIEQRTVKK